MNKNLVLLFILPFIAACSSAPEPEIKEFVQKNVAECGGKVESIILVREGLLSNKFVGFAEVKIGNKSYQPDLLVYADYSGAYFYKMETNPCTLAQSDGYLEDAHKAIEELGNLFN